MLTHWLCAGIQLRKVEEHRQQSERKKQTFGKPDVQTIMEAAFEQRRRAIEENDSDRDDDDDDDGDWDDEWLLMHDAFHLFIICRD